MARDNVPFSEARLGQAQGLASAIGAIAEQVGQARDGGGEAGPGPIFTAIGASFAAAAAPVWTLRQRGIHAWRLVAGDHPLPFPVSEHPVVGVSQSGRSTETLAALESIDRPLRLAVTNCRPSPIDAAADHGLWLGNLPDSYASTIGFSATVVGLGMMAEAWDGNGIGSAWSRIPELVAETQAMIAPRIARLAALFDGMTSVDVVGGGPAVGSAEAGALLLREVARVPASAMSTRQYLHGPMEAAGRSVHILLGDTREVALARMLADAGHRVILMTAAPLENGPCLEIVGVPALDPAPRTILEVVVLQALAEAVAVQAHLDIEAFVFDNPDTKTESSGTPVVAR